jgi:hypothetical protein
MAGVTTVGFIVVGFAVVGFAVVGFAVVGFVVVGFVVVGLTAWRSFMEGPAAPGLTVAEPTTMAGVIAV